MSFIPHFLQEMGERQNPELLNVRAQELMAAKRFNQQQFTSLELQVQHSRGSADEISDHFRQQLSQIWQELPYDKEEVCRLFTEDHLRSLSIEDTILFLQRFPAHFVTHVTRQGIRDHTSPDHMRGVGEIHDGFKRLLADGNIRSRLGCYCGNHMTEERVRSFLFDSMGRYRGSASVEEALGYLADFTDLNLQGRGIHDYADKSAMHFAAEDVLDRYYGAEYGNEIFIVYPSLFIASQMRFETRLCGPFVGNAHDQYNDLWVWNGKQSLPLDAGIVFIPAHARVHPETGSRYALDADGKPIVHETLIEAVQQFLDSSFLTHCRSWQQAQAAIVDAIRTRCDLLPNIFQGQTSFLEFLVSTDFLRSVWGKDKNDLMRVLQEHGYYFRESSTTISSCDYWEQYFAKQQNRPSKVVYYDGKNPTKALESWKWHNGLRKNETEDPYLGFREHSIVSQEANSQQELEQFRKLGERAIRAAFSDNR